MAEPTPTTAGQRLWAAVHDWRPEGDAEPLIWGPTELAILGQACGIADVVATLEAAVVGADAMVPAPRGRTQVNPLFGELRAQRLALGTLLGRLRMPDGLDSADIASLTPSQRGRRAARARWG